PFPTYSNLSRRGAVASIHRTGPRDGESDGEKSAEELKSRREHFRARITTTQEQEKRGIR
ncbi:hypothetical protein, partial [Burkholderia pseudomallei]|uniref:hypothetical protein n=1 Tax=Burkholderia pseudomallei TaxID=28450 RepID=UPI0019556597